MGWLRKIFGSKQDEARLERLVRRLIFYQDETTFLDGLREATALAAKGDDLGVRALSEAIRRRAGKQHVTFYSPPFGKLTTRTPRELAEAEDRLLELAKSHRLLDDPAATQNLMAAANTALGYDGIDQLILKIFIVAGVEQGYDFQLLFNQMHSGIRLRHARGERSWTEQMMDKAP